MIPQLRQYGRNVWTVLAISLKKYGCALLLNVTSTPTVWDADPIKRPWIPLRSFMKKNHRLARGF